MEDVLPKLDVLYMTRVQKERFFNEDDYIRMKDFYILDQSKMDLASPEMLVLHPLPRVNESPLTWITTRALLTLNRFSTVFMHVWP